MPRVTIFHLATLGFVVLCGSPAVAATPRWQASGRSTEGRLLEQVEIDGGTSRVMIVAGFRGTRNATTRLAESFARFASEQDLLKDRPTLLIVRDANPDGRANRTPTNARGVDVDRNFASSDWRKIPVGAQWLSGRRPASEPETQWIAGLVEAWKPIRIIVLLGDGPQAWIRAVGSDPSWRDGVAALTDLPWVDAAMPLPSGSFASWAAVDLKIPTLLINLPADDDATKFWQSQQPLITGIINNWSPEPRTIARIDRDSDSLSGQLKPKRRLVDVLWPSREEIAEIVRRAPVSEPVGRTISNRSTIGRVSSGTVGRERVYRLPPATHTVSRDAPPVRDPSSWNTGERYPMLQHRPIPIWLDPRGR